MSHEQRFSSIYKIEDPVGKIRIWSTVLEINPVRRLAISNNPIYREQVGAWSHTLFYFILLILLHLRILLYFIIINYFIVLIFDIRSP